MSVELVTTDSPAWQAALQTLDHDVYHTPAYSAIEAGRAQGRALAFLYRDAGDVFFLPLVIRPIPGTRRQDAVSGYGYPGPISTCPADEDGPFWHEAIAAMTSALASAGIVSCFVRLHPLLPVRLDALRQYGTLVEHGRTVAVDLTRPAEALWRGIRMNHRRQITAATASGLTVAIDDWSHLDEFMEAYYDNMRHVGAAPSYFFGRDYVAALRSELGGTTHLLTAQHGGEVVGGAMVFARGGIVQYHLGATVTAHRDKQPIKVIMHRIMEWGQQRGDRVLHLGGGLGGRDDSLFHFKAGFSDLTFPFHTWRVVTDPQAYDSLTAGCPPSEDSLFFPAYRRAG